MTAIRVTALVVVHHEESYIRECLESCRDCVDEIVIVHDGPCSDATLDIARDFTDRVYVTETQAGSAEFLRPFGLSQCRGDWVLVLDADERLTPALRAALPGLVDDESADSYGFAWPYVLPDGQPVTQRSVSGKRFLFRKDRMYTVGLPHMTPDTYGHNISRPDLAVLHVMKFSQTQGQIRRVFRQNRRRGRRIAETLAQGLGSIETFQADLNDPRVKNGRKLRLFYRHPLIGLITVPLYGFVHWYVARGYWRAGWIGLHDALNLPLCHAWTCLYRLAQRSKTGTIR
ncbi:MAG: glycosyltransferase [Pseudomonadota bacterium]